MGGALGQLRFVLGFSVLTWSGCITLTPEGARVGVYTASLETAQSSPLPPGCRLVTTGARTSMSESELEGFEDPFRADRNRAAAAGANVVLVRTRQTISRHDLECPGALRISDCPPGSGAWYDVVVESYACSTEALRALPPVKLKSSNVRESP